MFEKIFWINEIQFENDFFTPEYLKNRMISEQQLMEILKKYFETKGFVAHQLSSFNHMIQHSLQEIVGEESVIEVSPKQGVDQPNHRC